MVVGKPARAFFDLALRDMGLSADGVLMVGDDILTDIGGAQAAGMRGILVRTRKFRTHALETSGVRPDAVINSVGDIGTIL